MIGAVIANLQSVKNYEGCGVGAKMLKYLDRQRLSFTCNFSRANVAPEQLQIYYFETWCKHFHRFGKLLEFWYLYQLAIFVKRVTPRLRTNWCGFVYAALLNASDLGTPTSLSRGIGCGVVHFWQESQLYTPPCLRINIPRKYPINDSLTLRCKKS